MKCTVIIPIVTLSTDELKQMCKDAYLSVPNEYNVLIVGTQEALDSVEFEGDNLKKLTFEGEPTYQNQVNFAVSSIKTEYFSILEFDDEFSEIWFKNVDEYMSKSNEDVFAYLPLTEIVTYPDKQPIGYANEAFWASSFSEKIGYMDLESLSDYLGFNTSGGIFKTDDFKLLGKLKSSMKLTFWYEFLMRALYKEKIIRVIPKVGYFHTTQRPDSLTEKYKTSMADDEIDWWIDLAKKEFYFTNDRNKQYEQ